MIVDTVRGDIFESEFDIILFAVNTEGHNDAGFAGQVSGRYWPDLANTGPKDLGEVLTHRCGGRVYHALVCHSLGIGGWDHTPRAITECLDSLVLPVDSAMVFAGSGPIGQMQGADTWAILGGIARSKHRIVVYTR